METSQLGHSRILSIFDQARVQYTKSKPGQLPWPHVQRQRDEEEEEAGHQGGAKIRKERKSTHPQLSTADPMPRVVPSTPRDGRRMLGQTILGHTKRL